MMEFPTLSNVDISRMMGKEWGNQSPEEKKPFMEKEELLRAMYKEQMKQWRDSLASPSPGEPTPVPVTSAPPVTPAPVTSMPLEERPHL
eukprot:CAMPEP_0204623994 /NCGR_PEP_ID=MMETSP0717-20131115/9756_1 /ASSEMBLY_ACC=CAM_ASM_000666 /TAXON_ID=230516 /ORGANISM="Chaetoceros curvisetus" /LENGTH=88 /DNA_ID=CAMNT_0051639245 /DNA_START=87 /DNA_END=353 /DNA_ORIENTATION=+